MKLIHKPAVTNGIRHQINISKYLLGRKSNFVKFLIKGHRFSFGRSYGKIVTRGKGGHRKNSYRNLSDVKGAVLNICVVYNPITNAFINIGYNFETQKFVQSVAIEYTYPGSWLLNSNHIKLVRTGDRTMIKNIYPGALISNLKDNLKNKLKYIRAAGCFGQLLKVSKGFAKIKLPSSKIIDTHINLNANLGCISNRKHKHIVLGKAGKNRLRGNRPMVRGIAMNPVDHPHGGRTNGGRPSVSLWGLPTKCGFKLKKRK